MKRNLIHHTHIQITKDLANKTTMLNGVKTKLQSIGRDGFSIICNQERLSELLPNPAGVSPKSAVRFTSEFTLPGYEKSMITDCEAFYARRLSRDCFQMSLKFVALSDEQADMIDEFVSACLGGKMTREKPNRASVIRSQENSGIIKALNFAA